MRRHASRAELALLLLLSGDVHPNPGPLVRVGQLNCAGLTKEKRLSLLRRAADVDVLLLQELKMSEREALSFTLPGFQGIAKARNPNGGGVAVLVRDTIPTKVVASGVTSCVEYATVCTPLSGTMLYWTSAYYPRASRVCMEALEVLTGPALEHHIIGTDANAHHPVWDTRVPPNSAGTDVVDFCIANGYEIENSAKAITRRDPGNGILSTPDLTLQRGLQTSNWSASPCADSDHYWITFCVSFGGDDVPLASLAASKRARYLWGKADWPTFRKHVTQAAASFPWHGNVEQQAAYLSSAIRRATHAAVPSGVPGFKSAWTQDLERATQKCESLLKEAELQHTPELPTCMAQRRQLLRATNAASWAARCKELRPDDPSSWRTVASVLSPRPLALEAIVENDRVVTRTQHANRLAHFFAGKSRRHPHATAPERPPPPTAPFRPITKEELSAALSTLATHSAAGPDNVHNDSLIHLPPIGTRMLLSIMNKSLSRGIVPSSWRQGTIIPLLKPQKPANELSSYRPITLTSTLCKLMERVLAERLVEQVPLSDTQAGFRKGWSTTDVLVWLRSRLLEKNTAAVFVDFSRAFDSVDHSCILRCLGNRKADPYLIRWVHAFLSDRTARVLNGHRHHSRRVKMTCGVPQGSVLGPLLFTIVVDDPSHRSDINPHANFIAL